MKKTVNVNVGGVPFIINEDAFEMLRRYLNQIEIRLGENEDKEVLEDIEIRVADIFNENLSARAQVVDIDMVRKAMTIIGKAEEFGEPQHDEASENSTSERGDKKLYRSREDKLIGGVCGGVADYFDIDRTIVRVISFILIFFGGVSLWVYIILWIVLPLEPIGDENNFKFNKKNIRR